MTDNRAIGGSDGKVDLSVVVPTYNRSDRLARVLEALGEQHTVDATGRDFSFEVVVVSDGSTDGTDDMLREFVTPYPLNIVEQLNSGPAVARNNGVAHADGPLILFIDDDVIPEPGCLAAHIEAHRATPDLVVIGPMLTPEGEQLSPWVAWEQHQLEKQYARFEEDTAAHHRQFYTGNASLPASVFNSVDGFDETLRRSEDVELSQRLHAHGYMFEFEPRARAFHYAERSFESWNRIAYDYGRNDVGLIERGKSDALADIRGHSARRHPLLRFLIRALVPRPRVCKALEKTMARTALALAETPLRPATRPLLSIVYNLRYYRGVSDELGGADDFNEMMSGYTSPNELVVWFVLEQTLGHITHGKNLHSIVPEIDGVKAVFVPVDATLDGLSGKIPVWSNWTIQSGLRARRALRSRSHDPWAPKPDVMFVHTQVPAILLGGWLRKVPTVVSLDATPIQYDELGEFYRHEVGTARSEVFKKRLNERCFDSARRLVAWSAWTRQGLVEEYGVDESKISVISPGVDVEVWRHSPMAEERNGPLRVLFVGGDLERKGGNVLLEASRRLRDDPDVPSFEVHIVSTPNDISEPGVITHSGLTANSPGLIEQYHLADIFCLPTYGDCLPMVLAEASAAGLPVISTDVGAISEIVVDHSTGRLVAPGDVDALAEALRTLLTDPESRKSAGAAAFALAHAEHNARRNAEAIIDVCRDAAKADG